MQLLSALSSHKFSTRSMRPHGHWKATTSGGAIGEIDRRRQGLHGPQLPLASITDPLGHIWTQDPLGNATNLSYSPLGDLTQIMDALGGLTKFAYDGDRNLTSVTDANGNVTAYTYDPMDRRVSRGDPLGASESYTYDGMGNLTSHTDRNGNLTKYTYDGLNRRTFAGFGYNGSGYQSTIGYTWDGGDRLTQVIDSNAGTIARTYDGLDDLTDEQTPTGEVSYGGACPE